MKDIKRKRKPANTIKMATASSETFAERNIWKKYGKIMVHVRTKVNVTKDTLTYAKSSKQKGHVGLTKAVPTYFHPEQS